MADEAQTAAGTRVRIAVDRGVADVRLNRPEKRNALDTAMFSAIAAAGERLAALPGLRAVVLSGEGPAFCAGLDKGCFAGMKDAPGRGIAGDDLAARTHGPANLYQHAVLLWRRLPVPVIAAVHGAALGGGFQLMLGADMRFVAAEAQMSAMEIAWGLVPDMGGVLLMRELARADVVRELTYSGRVIGGAEAAALGLCTRVEPDPRAAALSAARAIADRSPDAIRQAKRLLGLADEILAARVLREESRAAQVLLGSRNQSEAVAANLEKRAPMFLDAT